MKKYWPAIKRCLSYAYEVLLFLIIIVNTYIGEYTKACLFMALFGFIVLDRGMGKIATAIRTQRNFHVIGDANVIKLRGAKLYADSVTVRAGNADEEAA